MSRRLVTAMVVSALVALAGATPGVAASEEPPASLLGEGCTADGVLHGKILPALRPCGVTIAPDGTAMIGPVGGRIAMAPTTAAEGEGWSRLLRPSPERRANAAMAYLPALDGVVMYGGLVCPGLDCSPVDETWLWNGTKWTRLQPPASPPPLHAAAMTYDPARQELVLFGGQTCTPDGCRLSSETWTFDGVTWERPTILLSPPGSSASAMAYDPKSSRVILSGGCAQDRCPGLVGTWSWNGVAWELEDLLTPSPRAGASAATNPGGGVVLFGGVDVRGGSFGETWVWDGEWAQRRPATSPPPRMYGGAAFDSGANQVILFAGTSVTCGGLGCSGGYVNDTWTWNGETWTERPADPAPRGGQSLTIAYDAARNEVVRFGGISTFISSLGSPTSAYESSTWLWDGAAWKERRSPMPEERITAAMGFHPEAQVTVLTGGLCLYTTTCDTWAFDGEAWRRIGTPGPMPNSRASLIPDRATGSLLFPLADAIWSLDYEPQADSWSWSALDGSSAPLAGGFATAVDRRGGVVMFGAQDCLPCTYPDQTWIWRGGSWHEAPTATRPPGRAFATMTFDPGSGDTILFGGLADGGQVYFKDVWTWNGDGWSEVAATGPRDRAFTRIAADPATGEVMLLGGISGPPQGAVLADQWMFNGSSWRQVTVTGPGPRIEHSLAGDEALSSTLLFGGQDANPGRPMSDTWIWTG